VGEVSFARPSSSSIFAAMDKMISNAGRFEILRSRQSLPLNAKF
jgi:hypothetical protein